MRVSRRRRKRSSFFAFLTGVLLLGMAAGLAFGLAWAWQGLQEAGTAERGSGESPSSAQPPAASVPVSAPPAESSSAPPSGDAWPVREEYPYALPETAEVPDSYFDDALFFGDSISVGIPLYNVMDNAAVIAFQGINTVNVNDKEAVDMKGDGVRVTMLEAAKQMYPDKTKIYIMLGGNGLYFDIDDFIGGYRAFVESVREAYPQASIYIQSMLPVTDFAQETYPNVTNERIDEYNLAVMGMAEGLGVYFVDTAAALVDETGKLPTEASPSDGMHISTEYYFKWFDYLRAHTAA